MLAASESVRADRVGEPVNVPVDDANDPVFPEAIASWGMGGRGSLHNYS